MVVSTPNYLVPKCDPCAVRFEITWVVSHLGASVTASCPVCSASGSVDVSPSLAARAKGLRPGQSGYPTALTAVLQACTHAQSRKR